MRIFWINSLLCHYPGVVSHAFKEKYDTIQWSGSASRFLAWCSGKTGYPLVDHAAAREITLALFKTRE